MYPRVSILGSAALRGGLIAAVLLVAAAAEAFPGRSEGRPRFVGNVVAVPAEAGSVQVEVSWEVPYRQLTFRREDDWYRARYDVAVVFLRDGRQVAGEVWTKRARARTPDEARARGERSRGRRTLRLAPGEYQVRLTLTDRISEADSEVRGKLDARFSGSGIGLSDVRFLRYREGRRERNPGHNVPLGERGHVFGVHVYPGETGGGEYELSCRLRDSSGSEVFAADSTVKVGGEPQLVEFALATDSLSIGEHLLRVTARGPRGPDVRRDARMTVRLTGVWFASHREDAFDVLRLLASDDERTSLEKAAEGEWAERVEAFWRVRDPDPTRPGNAYRDEIQARMEAAATQFVEPFRSPGWRTDRGEVLIQFGPPDRRAVRSADFDSPASEVWEYDSPRRTFFFVDVQGTGEFWLRG